PMVLILRTKRISTHSALPPGWGRYHSPTRDNKRHNHQTAASSITVPVVPHLVRTQNPQRCRLAGRTACSDQSVFDCEDDLQQTAGKWRRFFQKALQGKPDLPGYYGSSQGCLQNLPRLWLIRL